MDKNNPKKYSFKRKLLLGLVSFMLISVLIFALCEITTRILLQYTNKLTSPPYNTALKDELLGWFPKSNYEYKGNMKDKAGNSYPIHIHTDKHSFQAFGDLNPPDSIKKVWFIGDSYTQSVEVSNSKRFYHLLGGRLPIEVFAYGMSGYGTFQEYLILDKYYDLIQPDIIVLQYCSNDFIDNHYKLEMISDYEVHQRRPYLTIEGKTKYVRPVSNLKEVIEYSKFLDLVLSRVDFLKDAVYGKPPASAEKLIATQKRAYPDYDYAVKATDKIVQKIKERVAPSTQIVAFSSDIFRPQYGDFKKICADHQIDFIDSIAWQVKRAEEAGKVVKSSDGYHWNEEGHQIVAQFLQKKLALMLQ